jgi:hypothetical protein
MHERINGKWYRIIARPLCRSTLGLRTAMQQQYQLTFATPLAPPPNKRHQGDLTLPDDLASLQTVWSPCTLHAALVVSLSLPNDVASLQTAWPACTLHAALFVNHSLPEDHATAWSPCTLYAQLLVSLSSGAFEAMNLGCDRL